MLPSVPHRIKGRCMVRAGTYNLSAMKSMHSILPNNLRDSIENKCIISINYLGKLSYAVCTC